MMRYINYLDFSIYHVRLFLSLAENLNYTKTAEKCCITQSTLSRIIIQLENSLGIQLFIRSTSKVILTPAGKSLYRDLKNLYGDIEDAVRRAYRIQKGESSVLNLGICDGMNIMNELLPFITAFKQKNPCYQINIVRDYNQTLVKKLRDQTCDVIFDFTLKDKNDVFIKSVPLFSGPLMLYMLASNPLIAKNTLTLADLRGQRLLIRSPSVDMEQTDLINDLCHDLGIEPRFSTFVSNASELALNISNDNEGILADRYYIDRDCAYLHVRPIEGTSSTVWMRWVTGLTENSDAERFTTELLSFFRESEKMNT